MTRHRDSIQGIPGGAPAPGRIALWLALLSIALVLTVLISAAAGYIRIPVLDVMRVIGARLFDRPEWLDHMNALFPVVIMDIRLPRIIAAAVVGGGLAVSGTVFQGILLNPLADPYTLGVSAGAAFGAATALFLGLTVFGVFTVPLAAFAGASVTLVVVMYLSMSAGGVSSTNLILSGIIVAAILSAGIGFIKYLADEQVAVIIFWLMGSFAGKTWPEVGMVTGALFFGSVVFLYGARDLNLICLGPRAAASLGVDTRKTTIVLLTGASLVAAVCVSISGIIGFVGLLVPHIVRMITGPDHRLLLPASLLAGAILLAGADTLTRAVLPGNIPIGVITALIGGPFFCYVFRNRQRAGSGF